MSVDQLMRFDFDGRTGWGIFELFEESFRRGAKFVFDDLSCQRRGKTLGAILKPGELEAELA